MMLTKATVALHFGYVLYLVSDKLELSSCPHLLFSQGVPNPAARYVLTCRYHSFLAACQSTEWLAASNKDVGFFNLMNSASSGERRENFFISK